MSPVNIDTQGCLSPDVAEGKLSFLEDESEIELFACPQCGSEWFVSTRTGERIVFQIEEGRRSRIARPEDLPANAAPIDTDYIFCGACTWQGSVAALVESRM